MPCYIYRDQLVFSTSCTGGNVFRSLLLAHDLLFLFSFFFFCLPLTRMSFPEHRKSTEGKEKYGEINATYWVTVLLLCLLLKSNTTHECHLFRQSKASVFSHVWQPPVPSVSLEPQTFHRFQLGVGQNQLSGPTGRHYFNWHAGWEATAETESM